MKTYTRDDYLAGKCTHREYYGQFVTEGIKATVVARLGLPRLLAAIKEDEHLNTIPLATWDSFAGAVYATTALKKAGDTLTQAGVVCIAKEAARQAIEESEIGMRTSL